MFIQKKKATLRPSAGKRLENKPTNRAEIAKNGRKLGAFVVKSGPGFKIGGIHKFNIFKRKGWIVVEYCKPCSKARQWLKIDGEKVDYVASALSKYRGHNPATFDMNKMKQEFTGLLKSEFNRFNKS